MIINTFSYLWKATAIDAIAELVDSGYTTFEIPISSPHCWPDEISAAERSATRAKLSEYGADIRSLNAGGFDLNLASPAASMRRRSIEHINSVIELAAEWDVPEIVISPGTRRPMISPSLEQVHGWLYDSLDVLIPLAKQAGTRLLFEQTPYCFTPTIETLAHVVRTVDDDSLKIVYDVANAAYIGEDPVASLLSHHESIGLVHISDTGTDVWGHEPIGTGVIDWRALGPAVEATLGVDNVVLEVIREENTLDEFAQALRDLSREGWNLGSMEIAR
jgi:L-ribulose-5-phosphate 3-epimerase